MSSRGSSTFETSVQSADATEGSASPRALLLSGSVIAAVVFHMLAADVLGFVVTSAIILFATTKLLGARILTSAVVATVASVGIYQLFSGLLRVPLPIGFF